MVKGDRGNIIDAWRPDQDQKRFYQESSILGPSASNLFLGKGSCGELKTQIIIGMDIGYIDRGIGEKWLKETGEISSMLGGLIKTKKGFIRNPRT